MILIRSCGHPPKGIVPSGEYERLLRVAKALESAREVEDRRLGVLVREAHARGRQTYGSPRIHAELSAVNDRRLALKALKVAVKRGRPDPGLVHHTDPRSPYARYDYQQALEKCGITCSMSRRGNCYDSAVVESWFNQ